MKLKVDRSKGFIEERDGDGIIIDGIEGKQYPFKDLYDDLLGSVSEGNTAKGQAALTFEEYRDTGFPLYFMRHDQDDTLAIIYQMPHMWDPTTAVWPHIHYIPMAAASGDVYIEYQYAWAPRTVAIPAISGWTSGNVTASVAAGDQYKHLTVGLATITPPDNASASTMLLMKVTRVGDSGNDTYSTDKSGGTGAANFGILYMDLHYQKLRAGTVTQYYS